MMLLGEVDLTDGDEDPYRFEKPGFYFIASSMPDIPPWDQQPRLSYRWLLATMVGLFDVMVQERKPWGAYVVIRHPPQGRIGTALILPAPPDPEEGTATA